MAVRVRGDKSKDVELYLEDNEDGGVDLLAFDPDCPELPDFIATIGSEGIELQPDLSKTFGIATDGDGKVVIL